MIKDFPKLESPFIRKEINSQYILTPEINPKLKWVFESKSVAACDKIDGTNVSIIVKDSKIIEVYNRTIKKDVVNFKIKSQTRWEGACLEGLSKAIQRGWLSNLPDGQHFGELVGEIINNNRHQLTGHLWVPFTYLRNKCCWKSWSQNKYPKTYEAISAWFKDGLISLFNQKMKLPEIPAEGLVFYDHKTGKQAKLRKDMFAWFQGERH